MVNIPPLFGELTNREKRKTNSAECMSYCECSYECVQEEKCNNYKKDRNVSYLVSKNMAHVCVSTYLSVGLCS